MKHPLTDEIIEEIAEDIFYYDYSIPIFRQDMRAAYDKGRDDTLSKVIDWIFDNLEDQEDLRLVMERKDSISIPITLEELSMLPTQEDD